MAQRHGDALGAHARGLPQLAIAQLQKVARDAPSAPQVYSSLGMVYRDMFVTARNKWVAAGRSTGDEETVVPDKVVDEESSSLPESNNLQTKDGDDDIMDLNDVPPDETTTTTPTATAATNIPPVYREALDLAKRAYGSYHIAAILCKKDYDLWIRAADMACDIADMLGDVSVYRANAAANNNDNNHNNHNKDDPDLQCKKEQERWYNEAKNDLQTADNLKPPGLDVPIKLASVYMELGHFSEALTLWTDLLQRSSLTEQFRHTAWLLYAECMLHIGHECQQWNSGNESNDNYMFRRWLRKWSDSFDWKERRLQALVLALEAAAGSPACQQLMAWMRLRDAERNQQKEQQQQQQNAQETAAVSFAEQLVDGSAHGDDNGNDNSNSKVNDSTKGDIGDLHPPSDEAVENYSGGAEQDKTNSDDGEDILDPMAPVEGDTEYEAEKLLLLQQNELELEAFDQTTENMKQVLGNDKGDDSRTDKTSALKERRNARKKIVAHQQSQVNKLEGEYQRKKSTDNTLPKETDKQQDPLDANQDLEASAYMDGRSIPLAASCRVVTSIAAELMKHLLEMELYKGGRLAGEAVSLYMKERARIQDKKIQDRQRRDQQANPLGGLFLTQTLNYDEVSIDDRPVSFGYCNRHYVSSCIFSFQANDDDNSSDDGETGAAYLSDDEQLDSEVDGPRLLSSLRRGALPPEVSVLYSLCLIHEGGRNFVAKKFMDSIDHLEQESESWVTEAALLPSLCRSLSWYLCRAAAMEPLGRTAAYAFVADNLHRAANGRTTLRQCSALSSRACRVMA